MTELQAIWEMRRLLQGMIPVLETDLAEMPSTLTGRHSARLRQAQKLLSRTKEFQDKITMEMIKEWEKQKVANV